MATTNCPTIGDLCDDGTIYAGISPDGNVKMYVTPCDRGMNWNGTTCTGGRISLPWNNGNSGVSLTTTSVTDGTTGETNTADIIALDSDDVTAGVQPHQAAQDCSDLTYSSISDWYLPSQDEMDVLYTNHVAIGNFDTSGTYYWIAREGGGTAQDLYATAKRFSDGWTANNGHGAASKPNNHYIRCVRRAAVVSLPCNAAHEAVMTYNNAERVLQYCNGTDWIAMGPKGSGGNGVCSDPDGVPGEVGYNFTHSSLQYCNGADWIIMGPHVAGDSTAGSIPSTNLVSHWPIDDGTGSATVSDTQTLHTGTLTNMDSSTDWVTGKSGYALDFDGTDDVVQIAVTPGGAADPDVMTVTGWIYIDSTIATDSNKYVIHRDSSAYGIRYNTDDTLVAFVDTSNAGGSLVTAEIDDLGTSGDYDAWMHVAFTYDGTSIKTYKNGIYVGYAVQTGVVDDGGSRALFGAINGTGSDAFKGRIDEVRLYNAALIPAEIQRIFLGSGGGDEDPCLNSPDPGDVCLDGTVYAGVSPDGDEAMFVPRCDQGQVWNGTDCILARLQLSWNNDTTNWTVTGFTSATDGDGNTAGLNTLADVGSPYNAADECADLTLNGHSDWYLPAKDELSVIYTNRAAIGKFETGGGIQGYYWSSTEIDNDEPDYVRFGTGPAIIPPYLKTHNFTVRCARKGNPGPGGGTCSSPSGVVGEMVYNDDQNIMQYCNGVRWVGIP